MELTPAIPLSFLDGDLLPRLGAATVLGLLLGLDRELRGHAAGMRTHGLICFSAAIVTVSMFYFYFRMQGERMDPLRLIEPKDRDRYEF
ncbi:MAG: hypothetical protein FJX31_05880 [Alphaproteobacteria bacterium]|nr:hypothetical protein [Alphaproteobacteria bacterium]